MYKSTRGGSARDASFEEVLFSGYCDDGGIYVPKSIPKIQQETLKSWKDLSFVELAKRLIPLFVLNDEIENGHLGLLLENAYSHFSNPAVASVVELKNDLNILELFYGPTLAFKDVAMVCVGQFLQYFVSKRKKHSIVLVGTSGDTGSSAIEAMRGLEGIDVVVLLPKGRCTEIQELQMTTAVDNNIHVYRVEGSSDDLDEPIKRCFMDADLLSSNNLLSINSINWSRIMVQIVYFFYAYLKMCPSCDQEVEIVIPTGACGNVAAGCFAYKMGLPIKFVCSVNSNDVVARLISTGVYSIEGNLKQTLAPAMDIQVAYNVERLLWIFSDGDSKLVEKLLGQFEVNHHVKIPETVHQKMTELIRVHTVDDVGIQNAMRQCWTENRYLVCPHTATAVNYHYSHPPINSSRRVCIATASPAKFKEAVLSAGLSPTTTPQIEMLKSKPTKSLDMKKGEDWYEILKNRIKQITHERTRMTLIATQTVIAT